MTKNIHKTAQGQLLDMDSLRMLNEKTVAVGNMNVNSRGDRVTPSGSIIETRNQIMSKRYNHSTSVVREEIPTRSARQEVVAEETASVQETENADNTESVLRGSLASSVAAPAVVDGTASSAVTRFPAPSSKLKRI